MESFICKQEVIWEGGNAGHAKMNFFRRSSTPRISETKASIIVLFALKSLANCPFCDDFGLNDKQSITLGQTTW